MNRLSAFEREAGLRSLVLGWGSDAVPVRALEELVGDHQATRAALVEVHDFQCGCDTPGRVGRCVADPVSSFEVLQFEVVASSKVKR